MLELLNDYSLKIIKVLLEALNIWDSQEIYFKKCERILALLASYIYSFEHASVIKEEWYCYRNKHVNQKEVYRWILR